MSGPCSRWLLAGLLLAPLTVSAAPADPDQRDQEQAKAQARAEVQAGAQAFSAGDYAAAIEHYEAAMALLPAPKLHYNLGVCHQRLALQIEDPQERTLHRDEAVEHYNAYLAANPRAEDRFEIADTIRELGGQPVTMPTLIDPVFETAPRDGEDPQQGEAEPLDDGSLGPDDSPATEDEPPEPPPAPPKPPTHGRFLAAIGAGASPNLSQARAIDAPAIVSLELQGAGFVGPRRRLLIGAQTTVSSGAALRADGFAFFAYSLGLLLEQTFVLGRERDAVLLGVGAVAALTGQSLSQRTDVPPPICTIARGAQIAGRSGFMIAPRGEFEVLLGPRRRSMLGVQLQPSFAVFGDGPGGEQCSDGTTPWTELGVRRRWQVQVMLGLNYGFRF